MSETKAAWAARMFAERALPEKASIKISYGEGQNLKGLAAIEANPTLQTDRQSRSGVIKSKPTKASRHVPNTTAPMSFGLYASSCVP